MLTLRFSPSPVVSAPLTVATASLPDARVLAGRRSCRGGERAGLRA